MTDTIDHKAELQALREKHEITIMELTDLKEDNEKLKKLNTTLVQNFNKGPEKALREIRLIIDGSFYNQKVLDLESELDKLQQQMEERVENRAQEIVKNVKEQLEEKDKEKAECQRCGKLELILKQKDSMMDQLRLDLEALKAEYEILTARKSVSLQKYKQLERVNNILEKNLSDQQNCIPLDQHQQKIAFLNQEWQRRYQNLTDQFEAALDQLQKFKRLEYETQNIPNFSKESYSGRRSMMPKQSKIFENKEDMMKRQIKNLVGEIGSKKSSLTPRTNRNISTSRLNQSDFSQFSIKDAINRPNQLTFY